APSAPPHTSDSAACGRSELSSSAALLQATKSSIPASLLPITGVIPLTQTIFLWQNFVMAAVLIVVSVVIAYFSAPNEEDAKPWPGGARAPPPAQSEQGGNSGAILSVAIALLMFVYLFLNVREKGGLAALDLNNFNFTFLALGLLLHWRPKSFLSAVNRS